LWFWSGCPPNRVPGWKDQSGKCCGPGNLQCDAVVNPRAPPAAKVPAAKLPKVFVGSAYAKATEDMLSKPQEWRRVAARAGYFVHPMGFRPLGDRGAQLLRRYANKVFVIEESVGAAFEDRPRHLLDHWIAVMEQAARAGEQWRCAGVYLYVESERFHGDLDALIARYRAFSEPARRMGLPLHFFFTPLDVWNPKNYPLWSTPYKGRPLWIHFAKEVGATGVALDYPSWHWLETAGQPWKPELYRALATRICKTSRAAGLQVSWCLNGYCRSLEEVRLMARQLARRGVVVDRWLVDHFHDDKHAGTPETQPTVTGQAMALLTLGPNTG
jgi:hypothetical protein